jgi:hypothetical protein
LNLSLILDAMRHVLDKTEFMEFAGDVEKELHAPEEPDGIRCTSGHVIAVCTLGIMYIRSLLSVHFELRFHIFVSTLNLKHIQGAHCAQTICFSVHTRNIADNITEQFVSVCTRYMFYMHFCAH